MPGYFKWYLLTTLRDESFDRVIDHLLDKLGSEDITNLRMVWNLSNVKFSSYAFVSEIALRLDRLLIQAKELGVSHE